MKIISHRNHGNHRNSLRCKGCTQFYCPAEIKEIAEMIASLFYAQPVPKALSVISVISVWPLKFPFFFYFCGTKKTLFLLAVCGFFGIFAVQKNNDYLCLKTQDLSVARNSRRATFLTSNRCQPGWNYADYLPQTPIWHRWRSRSGARSFQPKSIKFTKHSGSLRLPVFRAFRALRRGRDESFPLVSVKFPFEEINLRLYFARPLWIQNTEIQFFRNHLHLSRYCQL